MNLTKISIKRPTAVIIVCIALAAFGIYSLMNINQELMPKVSTNTISITTLYPGAGVQEVENSVTKKIEEATAALEGIDNVMSTSMENFSLVTITLKPGTNLEKVMQEAQREVNKIRSELPDDAKEPAVTDFKVTDIPIMTIGVTSSIDEMELYEIVDSKIKPALERISGVGRVALIGGLVKEVQVNIDEDKLKSYELSISHVAQILITSNMEFPTGKLINEEKQLQIRLEGKFQTPSDIGHVILKTLPDGTSVMVKDVAEVADTYKEVATINRTNGIPSIGITIQRSADANTVEISKIVAIHLALLKKKYEEEKISFVVAVDNAEFTIESANSVLIDLVLAIGLVAVTILLFLQSFRNSIFAAVAIPLSLIITFIPMYLFGFSLNIMSLLGLTLVIGILVDDAIVVIENIHKHLERGKTVVQAAYDGVKEIGFTVISITLVIVVVFVPISLTQGTISDVFRQFALTIAIAVIVSLAVAFTVIPLIYSRFGKLEKINPDSFLGKLQVAFERGITSVASWFGNILNWSFSNKTIVFATVGVLLVSSMALIDQGFIGSDFAPQGDQGQFVIKLELPKDVTIQQTNASTFQAESIVRNNSAVENVFTTVGAEENGQSQASLAELRVKLVPHKNRKISAGDLAQELKSTLQRTLPDVIVSLGMTDMMGNIDEAPVRYYVTGQHIDTVRAAAHLLLEEMKDIKGVVDPELSTKEGNPQISIVPDRKKMADLGVAFADLGQTLSLAFSGNTDAKLLRDDKEYDINIRLDQADREQIQHVENISVMNNKGQLVQLKQFASITETQGPTLLERRDRNPSISVSAQVGGRPIGDIGADINQAIEHLNLSEQIEIIPGGELEMQGDSFGSLGMALLVSIFLVYFIMVLLYNSFVYPLVVLGSLPLAIIGALLALALTMQTLNVFTLLGMIVLIGLVAKNAILLVDFTNHLKEQEVPLKDALLQATHERFRPIVMTTLAMVVGMLPVALASGAAAEWKNGLAWVIIGGLISSLFLTLIVVPLFYYVMDRLLSRIGSGKRKEIVILENE
ncbi:efflux RND transporter permease subunit [Sphingobacterium paludis]|uniref:HAE1 family hydrophobic/amphiphilic exporter-1 n=1 Tax=Sphingobacterium paludis TaxID=1476465 RepID=A0A4R7CYT8_9SPHI|nr:efflux RND transporter permease subunit [Sphingobacterium paludis]TDS13107.1 HAE1 family hydrophobic/amphiphilic exporter-1 [Sphingobacterium paludis]